MGKRRRKEAFPLGDYLDIEAEWLNNQTFMTYLNRLVTIRSSLIEWDGLPEEIDQRWVELCMVYEATVLFSRDEYAGYIATKYTARPPYDIYFVPYGRYAIANNGYKAVRSMEDSVIAYDNNTRVPAILEISMYAKRLAQIQRAIDLNAEAQRNPILVLTNDERQLTMENILSKYRNNTVAILGDENFFAEKDFNSLVSTVDLQMPFKGQELETYKEAIWDEALCATCGINSVFKKKERAITQELDNAQEEANAVRFSMLAPRQKAAQKLNKMYGLNVTPRFRILDISEVRNVVQQ